jgi:hypothetical protein
MRVFIIIALMVATSYGQTIHKFGHAPKFSAAAGEVTIWDAADSDSASLNYTYDWPTGAGISNIVSSSTSDVTTITIEGLDANTNMLTQSVVLNGATPVALTQPMHRVFRAYNSGSTNLVGNITIYSGANVYGLVGAASQQTEMALYTVPLNFKAKMKGMYFSIARGIGTAADYDLFLYKREAGGVFRLQHRATIDEAINGQYLIKFEKPLEFAEGTDIELRATTTGADRSIAAGFEIELEKIRYY